jgi:hypothetical protein
MNPILVALSILVAVGGGGAAATQPPASPAAETAIPPAADFDDAAAIAALRASITGREREPEAVFRDIQIHRGRPAAAILSIMELGYSRSLGVHCTHCHDPSDWSSAAKPTKRIAREMSEMVLRINEELLAPIDGLRNERPVVNDVPPGAGDSGAGPAAFASRNLGRGRRCRHDRAVGWVVARPHAAVVAQVGSTVRADGR